MAILTVSQLREHVTTSLGDDAVQRLLDAAEAAITAASGGTGEVTETIAGWTQGDGYHRIALRQRVGAITSVTEYVGDVATILDATDYRVSGFVLYRLDTGTHTRWHWGSRIVVTYTPASDAAERARVQIALVELDVTYKPGLASITVEGYGEQFGSNSAWNYEQERAAILATLGRSGGGMVVIG